MPFQEVSHDYETGRRVHIEQNHGSDLGDAKDIPQTLVGPRHDPGTQHLLEILVERSCLWNEEMQRWQCALDIIFDEPKRGSREGPRR